MAQIQSYIDTLKSQGHAPGSPGYYKAFQDIWYREGKPVVYYPRGASQDEGGIYEATVRFWDPAEEQQRQAEEAQRSAYWDQRRAENEQAKSAYGGQRTEVTDAPVGAKTPTVTREQLEAKAKYIQSPTAQYASEQSFQQAAGSVQQYRTVEAKGVVPSVISQERIPEPQPQQKPLLTLGGAIAGVSPSQFKDPYTGQDTRDTGTRNLGKIPLFDPVSGKPNIIFTTPAVQSEIKRDPKYGFMVRQDIAERQQAVRREELLRSSAPDKIAFSSLSMKSREIGERYGERVRGFTVDTSRLPQEIKESPGFKGGEYLFGLGRESTAGVIEFGGVVPGTVELIGKTAIKQPSGLPKMVVVGGLEFVGSTARQAKENPAQLISDLVVTAGVFKGIGLGARGIGTGAKAVKTTAPKAVTFFAEGFKPVPKVDTTGMTLGQKMFGRPITKELKMLTEVTPFKRSPRETLKSWTEVTRYEKSPREVIKSVTEMTPFKKSARDVLKSWTEVTPFEKSPRDVLKSWTEVTPFEKSPRDVLKSSTTITPFKKSPRKVVKSFLEVKPYGGKTKAISEPIIRRIDTGTAGVFKGVGRGAKAVKTTAPKLGISKVGFKRFVESESAELLPKSGNLLEASIVREDIRTTISKRVRAGELKFSGTKPAIRAESPYALQPLPQKAVRTKVATLGREDFLPTKAEWLAQSQPVVIPRLKNMKLLEMPAPKAATRPKTATQTLTAIATATVTRAKATPQTATQLFTPTNTRTKPRTETRLKLVPQTLTVPRSATKTKTQAVTLARTATLAFTRPQTKTSPALKLQLQPQTRTQTQTKTAPELKFQSQPRTRAVTRTKAVQTLKPQLQPRTRVITTPKLPLKVPSFRFGIRKPKKGKSKSSKFFEITPVTLPSAMLGRLRTKAKGKAKAKPRKQTRKQKTNRRKHNK